MKRVSADVGDGHSWPVSVYDLHGTNEWKLSFSRRAFVRGCVAFGMDKSEYAELLVILEREIRDTSITIDILNSKQDLFRKMIDDQMGE